MKDKEALDMICETLEKGLKNKGCEEVHVIAVSKGELEIDFILKGERFHFYFG
jgi:hypothetical protein